MNGAAMASFRAAGAFGDEDPDDEPDGPPFGPPTCVTCWGSGRVANPLGMDEGELYLCPDCIRCPACDGTGMVAAPTPDGWHDDIVCPECRGWTRKATGD